MVYPLRGRPSTVPPVCKQGHALAISAAASRLSALTIVKPPTISFASTNGPSVTPFLPLTTRPSFFSPARPLRHLVAPLAQIRQSAGAQPRAFLGPQLPPRADDLAALGGAAAAFERPARVGDRRGI